MRIKFLALSLGFAILLAGNMSSVAFLNIMVAR